MAQMAEIMTLAEKYTGDAARDYERKRTGSWKWASQHEAVKKLLIQCQAKSVLDVACGTGRFVDLYKELGIVAQGVEVSKDMADIATKKGMKVYCWDFFESEFYLKYDVVLAIRFLNWLDPLAMSEALHRMSRINSKHIIVSITTSDEAFVSSKRAYIPTEEWFSGVLEDCNLKQIAIESCDAKRRDRPSAASVRLLEFSV
jgi:ubiquinone/menaquinone biosynthesis C-methylase UbiE